jgi:type IV secretory pathway VirB2 component (pilin)
MKKYIFTIVALLLLVVPMVTFAQNTPENAICNVLNRVKSILLAVGVAIAVIFIIVAGIMYMTAQGDEEKTKKAKTMIINALIGVAIMLLALFLVSMVQSFMSTSGIGNIFAPNQCIGTNN